MIVELSAAQLHTFFPSSSSIFHHRLCFFSLVFASLFSTSSTKCGPELRARSHLAFRRLLERLQSSLQQRRAQEKKSLESIADVDRKRLEVRLSYVSEMSTVPSLCPVKSFFSVQRMGRVVSFGIRQLGSLRLFGGVTNGLSKAT